MRNSKHEFKIEHNIKLYIINDHSNEKKGVSNREGPHGNGARWEAGQEGRPRFVLP